MAWYRVSMALIAICLPVSAQAAIEFDNVSAEKYPESTSVVQRLYDDAMQASSTLAGAPNATARSTQTKRLKIAPNAIDRNAKAFMDFTADIGGARKAFATEKNGMPRHTLETLSQRMKAPKTPILLDKSAPEIVINSAAPKIIIDPPQMEKPVIADQMPNVQINAPAMDLTNNAKAAPKEMTSLPMIGMEPPAQDPIIVGTALNPNAMMIEEPKQEPTRDLGFMFRKIDQNETLTTPLVGQPN